jgi:hypothetical protein
MKKKEEKQRTITTNPCLCVGGLSFNGTSRPIYTAVSLQNAVPSVAKSKGIGDVVRNKYYTVFEFRMYRPY